MGGMSRESGGDSPGRLESDRLSGSSIAASRLV